MGLLVACAVAIEDAPLTHSDWDGGVRDGAGGFGASGNGGSGGSAVNGGWGGINPAPPPGGTPGTSGASSTGNGGAGSTECTATQKRCNGTCVEPAASVGCTLDDCTPCPALWNAKSGCAEGACTLECNSGYVKEGNLCVAPGAGGSGTGGGSTGGRTGSGGSSGCSPTSCPACNIAGPFQCCTDAGRCGCSWFPIGYCF